MKGSSIRSARILLLLWRNVSPSRRCFGRRMCLRGGGLFSRNCISLTATRSIRGNLSAGIPAIEYPRAEELESLLLDRAFAINSAEGLVEQARHSYRRTALDHYGRYNSPTNLCCSPATFRHFKSRSSCAQYVCDIA